jgi:FMN-dependent NADH-azoreductase
VHTENAQAEEEVRKNKLVADSHPQYLFDTFAFVRAQEVAEVQVEVLEVAEDHTPTLVEQAHLELAQELEAQVNTLKQA